MDFDRLTIELLRPAADQLRRTLQRMDDDDVPSPLRPLADSSARRIPPPIVRRALVELDESEWLRAEVAASDEELDEQSPAGLFVLRPEGWEDRLAAFAAEAEERQASESRSALERRLADALARIEELEADLRTGAVDVASAERRVRDRLHRRIEGAERGRRLAESRAREEARRAAQISSRVQRLEAELQTAEERIESLRQMLERERRAPGPVTTTSSGGWFPDDPAGMAEHLDRIVVAVRRPPLDQGAAPAEPEAVRLPEGMRPDRAEAVRWLLGRPLRWLIDGYNVAFQVSGEPGATTRNRLIAAAGQISTLSPPGAMVVVVFDSSVDTSTIPSSKRARVVYVHSADEWILEHAADGTVVVTSDREVREGAEEAGAIGIWSEALAAWIGSGGLGPVGA